MKNRSKYFTQISTPYLYFTKIRRLQGDEEAEVQGLLDRGFNPENEVEEKIFDLLKRGRNFDALRVWEEANDQFDDYKRQRLIQAFHRTLHTRISLRLQRSNVSATILDPQIDRDFETLRQIGTLTPADSQNWIYHLMRTQKFETANFLTCAAQTIFPNVRVTNSMAKIFPEKRSAVLLMQEDLVARHYLSGNLEEAVRIQLSLVEQSPDSEVLQEKLNYLIRSVETQAREALFEHLCREDSNYGLKPTATRALSSELDFDSLSRISSMLKERAQRPMILVAFDMLRSDSLETALASAYAILRLSPYNPDSWELARSTALRCLELASLSQSPTERDTRIQSCLKLLKTVETLSD